MLAVLVALLGFGGYLTIHTLNELAVAQMKSGTLRLRLRR